MGVKYRRHFQPGGTYFFTVVTYQRQPIFINPEAVALLMDSINHVQQDHPFTSIAHCICPDHIHVIWKLPQGDSDYPVRWRLIKAMFSRNWIPENPIPSSRSRIQKHERTIWQRRYWEHVIQDEKDLAAHIDYIHYNPVKHGLAQYPDQWEYSSFRKFIEDGYYSSDWVVRMNDNPKFNTIGKE